MPVYDKRYEDQPTGEYVNIVLTLVSPYNKSERASIPRFGHLELSHDQLGYLPVYMDYEQARKDYPTEIIHQLRIPTDGK